MNSAQSVRLSICNVIFTGLAHFFSDFVHEGRVQKISKMTEPFFEKNSCYAQNRVNWAFLVSKSILLNFSLKL